MLATRMNTGFPKSRKLFQLDRSRRFTREIVHYAVDSLDLIDNPIHAGLVMTPRSTTA